MNAYRQTIEVPFCLLKPEDEFPLPGEDKPWVGVKHEEDVDGEHETYLIIDYPADGLKFVDFIAYAAIAVRRGGQWICSIESDEASGFISEGQSYAKGWSCKAKHAAVNGELSERIEKAMKALRGA